VLVHPAARCCKEASQAERRGFETHVPLLGITENFVGTLSERAPAWTNLLEAVEQGDEVEARALAVRLAAEVLASPVIALAREVLAGGPHATAKVIELAEHLLPEQGALLALPKIGFGDGGDRSDHGTG
jgi:hypothetical protein